MNEILNVPWDLSDWRFTYLIGWLSALGCFAICVYTAGRMSKHPRLYTVIALFAGAWVLVMGAVKARWVLRGIEGQLQGLSQKDFASITTGLPDLVSDLASFLFIYAGAILAREAAAGHWVLRVQHWFQLAGLALLFSLVLPNPWLQHVNSLYISELIGAVGFASLVVGARPVTASMPILFWMLVCTVLAYTGISVVRTWELLNAASGPRPVMQAAQIYTIVFLRFALTGLFCWIVLRHYRSPQGRATREEPSGLDVPA